MEGLLAVALGAAAVAAVPFVPALRPVAKAAVKGTLAIVDVAAGAAALTSYTVHQLFQSVGAGSQTTEESSVSGGEEAGAAAEETIQEATEPAVETRSAVQAEMAVTAGPEAALDEASDNAMYQDGALAASDGHDAAEHSSDLILIDGIGPKAAAVLEAAGVTTLTQLAVMDEAQLREILTAAGARYRAMDPGDWPAQARQLLESSLYSADMNE